MTLPSPPHRSGLPHPLRSLLAPGSSGRAAARVVGLYVVVGALWILLSDRAMFALVSDPELLARLGLYKGWCFVAGTAAVLFWHLRAKLELMHRDEEKLRLFIDHAPVALAMLDRELRYVTASRRWCTDFGLVGPELRGRRHYDVFPEIPERWREVHRRALAGESLREEADRFVRANGSVQWLRWEVRPWSDEDGAVGGIVIFSEDVTARLQTEEALARAQSRLRLALECGHVGTWSWDVPTDQAECDEALARMVGRSREDFGRGGHGAFLACLHPEDRAAVAATLAAALRDGPEFVAEYRVVRPDGRVLWIADRASVERDAAGHALRLIGACVDITTVKHIERALHESENRFREVVETISEVFWIWDAVACRILYVSPAYEAIWGRPCADLYVSRQAWLDSIHPEDRERVAHAANTKQAAGTYDESYRIIRPDLGVRWIHDRAYPVRDEHGVVCRIVGTAEDVTDRNRLEEQFLRAQRLEAIGTLASGVAHDLNNILAPMFMIGPILRPKLVDAADKEILTIVERSAHRGAEVVRQLLTFSRGIAGERGPLQPRHLVKEMVAIMNETFPREIGVNHLIPADLAAVIGDATQLHQVLMNLCVNARDAMAEGGKLSIEGRNVLLDDEEVRGQTGVKAGRFVVLTVRDTGHGIPADVRTRIFEPFFTTKEIGKGTGLGLSTVIGIVKSHGGFVTLESEIGRGSAFHVHLPAADAEAILATPVPPATTAPGRGELVLVVDDEPAVRMLMQHVLQRHGYRVLAAANGREGLALFLVQRERVRAVVTDLMMPEMGGIALVSALRELSPHLAILAATGLDGTDKRDALGALGVSEVLPKPYTPTELLDALERELARSRAAAAT